MEMIYIDAMHHGKEVTIEICMTLDNRACEWLITNAVDTDGKHVKIDDELEHTLTTQLLINNMFAGE